MSTYTPAAEPQPKYVRVTGGKTTEPKGLRRLMQRGVSTVTVTFDVPESMKHKIKGGSVMSAKMKINLPGAYRVYTFQPGTMVELQLKGTHWIYGYEATLDEFLRSMVHPFSLPFCLDMRPGKS